MRTVAVTGVSGYLGRKVAQHLGDDPRVARLVGIDLVDPNFSTRNLEFYRVSVTSPELTDVISDCDTLIHLATNDSVAPEETYETNVGGTRAATDAASRAGVSKLIFASSVAVYGAHPDNDFPLTESSPVRPLADSAYGGAKAEAEGLVEYFAREHPEVVVTSLRFAWVCGPTIPTARAALFDSPFRLAIASYEVPVQALHEDDMAKAVGFVVSNELRGVYNVCAEDWVDSPEGILGQRRITLELGRARSLLERASRVRLAPLPSSDLPSLMYPQVMSNAKIRGAGFEFEHSTADALRQGAEARREWVALGQLRFRPRRVALAAGTFGAVFLGSAARSAFGRRSRRGKA